YPIPVAVSVFNRRAIFTYLDTLYVFSLVTRTWSRWRAPSRGGIARILERRGTQDLPPQAYAMPATRALGATSASLYRITDGLSSDNESFECMIRTKIYSFDAAQLYKRLFWWGLDGIFRKDVTAVVMPIVYGGTSTWGEFIEKGITWGDRLLGAWGRPTSPWFAVETVRRETGATAQRKFTKFNKKLRFPQLQFQLTFETTGDDQTAPKRLFSIDAEVTPAQVVAKA